MDKEPGKNQRVVTVKECLIASLVSLVLSLVYSVFGLWLVHFSRGQFWVGFVALFPAAQAIFFLYIAARQWKNHVAIKGGAVIYAKRMTHNSEDWIASSVGTLLLLTCISILSTIGCLWLWQLLGKDSLVCVFLGCFFWVYTLFCWYRFLFRRPKAIMPTEPLEGVWPPPPIRPDQPPT